MLHLRSAFARTHRITRTRSEVLALVLPVCRRAVLTTMVFGAAVAICHAQVSFTEYPGPTTPAFDAGYAVNDIMTGPDGNLWFTEGYAFGSQTSIGMITPDGITTYFPVPSGSSEGGIASGPDGNLWFTEYRSSKIAKLTTSGQFTEFSCGAFPSDIKAGTDGNLWYTTFVANTIGRITPQGVITEFPVPSRGSNGYGAYRITPGPDGNMWFTTPGADIVGKITPVGGITEYKLPSGSYPLGITTGPDANLWFVENLGNKVGRITPAGAITEFPIMTPQSNPVEIVTGPDGNLWFTERAGNKIAQLTSEGVITEYPAPTAASQPAGITTGPDGNLWFTEAVANKIVKAVLTPPDSSPPTTSASLSGTAGANNWYTSAVQVTLSATDPDGSADVAATYFSIDGGLQQTYSGPFNVTADGVHNISFWSVDHAGNAETAESLAVKIDQVPPTITITAPTAGPYLLNQAVAADFSAADATSGVATLTGAVPGGSNIDTSSVGAKTLTVTATDNAGNTATAAVTYTVSYAIAVLYDQTKAVKSGATIPIKLQITDANGANVSTSGIVVHATGVTLVSTNAPGVLEDAGNANPDSDFRYDPTIGTTGGYIFNLKTTGYATGTFNLSFTAGADPAVHAVGFQVK